MKPHEGEPFIGDPATDRWKLAIQMVNAEHRRWLDELGFDTRFVIKRNARKRTVTLGLAADYCGPHPPPLDFGDHLISLANSLGLQGKRVVKILPSQEQEHDDYWSAVLHWEWVTPRKRRREKAETGSFTGKCPTCGQRFHGLA